MKIRRRIEKEKKIYSSKDARKNYWGWTSTASSSSEAKTIEVYSSEDQLMKLIATADERGYKLEDFRLEFSKVVDDSTRMEVTFIVDVSH